MPGPTRGPIAGMVDVVVVGLHCEQDEVNLTDIRGSVSGGDGYGELLVVLLETQPIGLDCREVLAPGDEADVVPCASEECAQAPSDTASSHHRDAHLPAALDLSFLGQLCQVVIGQAADAAQYLGVVVAEKRGLAIGGARRALEVDGGVHGAEDATHVVPAVNEHSAGFQVGTGVEVGLVLDHAHGVSDFDEALQ